MSQPVKPISEMIAEGLREAGILLLVFGPMYQFFDSDFAGWKLGFSMLLWIVMGGVAFGYGLYLERSRHG